MSCSILDPGACIGDGVSAVAGAAIDNMATAVKEAYGKAIASVGTVWLHVGTPNLTADGGTSSITAGSSAPSSGNITTVLGYVMWISLAVAVLSLFALGAFVATRVRAGEGFAGVGRLGMVLGGVVLVSGASALVSGVMPAGPSGAGGAVLFLQSGLWWYTGAAAVASVVLGGVRMAWEQRSDPGRETVKGLLTLLVVASAGVTIVGLLVAAADSFSIWLINGSLSCDVAAAGSTCFGDNMLRLLSLTTTPASGLGSLLIIILGLIAVLASAAQIVLMVARGAMLVVLTGVLPLSASFTNTEMGRAWFKKGIAWLVAFILYKPAAAVVYAAAFQLSGTSVFTDDGSGLYSVLTGLMLMVIALFAMPALMRFVTPMVGALAGGGTGAAAGAGALAALPSGAAALGRLTSGGSEQHSGGSSSGAASGPSGSHDSAGSPPSSGGSASAPPQAAGATTQGSSAAAAGSSRAAAGSGAGGAAAGSAAAGPVGVAAGAALEVASGAGHAAAGAARAVGEDSTGEGGGPGGSR